MFIGSWRDTTGTWSRKTRRRRHERTALEFSTCWGECCDTTQGLQAVAHWHPVSHGNSDMVPAHGTSDLQSLYMNVNYTQGTQVMEHIEGLPV